MKAAFSGQAVFLFGKPHSRAKLLYIMASDLDPTGPQPTGTKRKAESLADSGDRAANYRKPGGNCRFDLERLAFHPDNRGGLGCSAWHAHEVAWDGTDNGVSLRRYKEVEIVEIPPEFLQGIKDANRRKCEEDPLMPKFSESVTHVTLGGTHFTTAAKLAKEGHRTVFNEGKIKINWSNAEAVLIKTRGIMTVEYSMDLFRDPAALHHLMGEDNLNAQIQMKQDEMPMFGKVERIMRGPECRSHRDPADYDLGKVLEHVELEGVDNCTEAQIIDLVKLRATLTLQVTNVFTECQFHMVGGKVRVSTKDFGLAATLDARCPWVKIAILLHLYFSTLKQGAGPSYAKPSERAHFAGRAEVHAKRLPASYVKQLLQEVAHLLACEKFVKQMLKHYSFDPQVGADPGQVLQARARLLVDVGLHVLRIGSALEQETQNTPVALSGPSRDRVVDSIHRGAFEGIEAKFAARVLAAKAFTEKNLPAKMYKEAAPATAAPSQNENVIRAARLDDEGNGILAPENVLERLGVKEFPAQVRLRRGNMAKAESEGAADSADAGGGSEPAGAHSQQGAARGESDQGEIMIVTLLSLSLPTAVVTYTGTSEETQMTVPADALLPYEEQKGRAGKAVGSGRDAVECHIAGVDLQEPQS